MYSQRFTLVLVSCLIACFISACSPKVRAPVEERSVLTERQEIQKYGGHLIRMVKPGDTLYGIAFESNLSVKTLAAWNDISDYRSLKVGQRLRLTAPLGFVAKKTSKKVVNVVKTANKPRADVSTEALSKPSGTKKTSTALINKKPKTKNRPNVKKPVSPKGWMWPVNGKVVRSFAPKQGRQGIEISTGRGSVVKASRAGEVVYVGSSLRGYGKLIIIKHDGEFLSAYAHNDSILVKEGQMVVANQKIGTSGVNNRGAAVLQFQIRIDGNSVNPLPYLRG